MDMLVMVSTSQQRRSSFMMGYLPNFFDELPVFTWLRSVLRGISNCFDAVHSGLSAAGEFEIENVITRNNRLQ